MVGRISPSRSTATSLYTPSTFGASVLVVHQRGSRTEPAAIPSRSKNSRIAYSSIPEGDELVDLGDDLVDRFRERRGSPESSRTPRSETSTLQRPPSRFPHRGRCRRCRSGARCRRRTRRRTPRTRPVPDRSSAPTSEPSSRDRDTERFAGGDVRGRVEAADIRSACRFHPGVRPVGTTRPKSTRR